MITREQMIGARELVKWSQARLAAEAAVSQGSISHFESGRRRPSDSILISIRRALQRAGIEFPNKTRTEVRWSVQSRIAEVMRQHWDLKEWTISAPELIDHANLLIDRIRHGESDSALETTIVALELLIGVSAPVDDRLQILKLSRELLEQEDESASPSPTDITEGMAP